MFRHFSGSPGILQQLSWPAYQYLAQPALGLLDVSLLTANSRKLTSALWSLSVAFVCMLQSYSSVIYQCKHRGQQQKIAMNQQASDKKIKVFLNKNKQNGDFNQYWYSAKTIKFLSQQAEKNASACFLSTPSIYFALENPNHEKPYYVFDLDEKFGKNNPNYFKYDFNKPEEIPAKFENYFDFVLADPPFITEQVWAKFSEAIHRIIKKQDGKIVGRVLLSTIDENEKMLGEMLGVSRRKWRPSIPHLVYQYSLYSNYEDEKLDTVNEEIGE